MQHAPPIVFLHLFKCGGTSAIDRIGRIVGKDRLYHARSLDILERDLSISGSAIQNTAVIAGHVPLPAIQRHFPASPIFTIVRDPIDRMISQYFHFRREGQKTALHSGGKKQGERQAPIGRAHAFRCAFCAANDFSAFVTDDDPRLTAYTRNHMARRIAGVPVSEQHQIDDDDLRARAFASLERFAFTLSTDQIDTALAPSFKSLTARHFANGSISQFSWPARRKRNVSRNRTTTGLHAAPSSIDALISRNLVDLSLYSAVRWFGAGSIDLAEAQPD